MFYPAVNVLAATLARHRGNGKVKGFDLALLEEARAGIRAKNGSDPDFWSLVAAPEVRLYEAIARGTVVKDADNIVKSLRDVHRRSQGGAQWQSVADTMGLVLNPYIARASAQGKTAGRSILEAIAQLSQAKP